MRRAPLRWLRRFSAWRAGRRRSSRLPVFIPQWIAIGAICGIAALAWLVGDANHALAQGRPPGGAIPTDTRETFLASDYGVNGDDTASDQAGMEAAVAAAQAVGGVVKMPRGDIYVERPIYVPSTVAIRGAGKHATVVKPVSGYHGYAFIVAPDHTTTGGDGGMDYDPPLVGAVGQSLNQDKFAGSEDFYLDLTQYNGMDLPSAGWSVEFWAKVDTLPTGGEFALPLWGCGGDFASNGTHDEAILSGATGDPARFDVLSDGTMRLLFRYNGNVNTWAVATASHTTLTLGDVYHFEINWNGTNAVRVFVNGEKWTEGDKAPAAGVDSTAFKRYPWEACTIGGGLLGPYWSDERFTHIVDSHIDGLRVSSVVRHTADFTPPAAKYASDVDTILLVNFTEFYKDNVVATGGEDGRRIYLRHRAGATTETTKVELSDFGMEGTNGIWAEFNSENTWSNIYHFNQTAEWRVEGNGYFSKYSNIDLIASSAQRPAWKFGGGSSYIGLSNITVSAPLGLSLNSVNAHLSNVTATMLDGYYSAFHVVSGTTVLDHVQTDSEVADDEFLAAMVLEDPQSFSCQGCTLYGFDDEETPVTVIHAVEPTAMAFERPTIFAEAATPFLRTFGALSTFATPIAVLSPYNEEGAPIIAAASGGQVALYGAGGYSVFSSTQDAGVGVDLYVGRKISAVGAKHEFGNVQFDGGSKACFGGNGTCPLSVANDGFEKMRITSSAGMVLIPGSTGKVEMETSLQLGSVSGGEIISSSTKLRGSIALSGGTGTATVLSGAFCVCSNTSSATACRASVSSTTLTVTSGAGTDTVSYICIQ